MNCPAVGNRPWLWGPTVVMLSSVHGLPGPSVAAVHGLGGPSMAAAFGPGNRLRGTINTQGKISCKFLHVLCTERALKMSPFLQELCKKLHVSCTILSK